MKKIIKTMFCEALIFCLSGCSENDNKSEIDKDNVLNTMPESDFKKDDVLNMMLESDFRYDNISGRIIKGKTDIDNPITIEFNVNMVDGESYSKMTDNNNKISVETFVKDSERIDFDNINKSEHIMSKSSTKRESILKMSEEDYENYKLIKESEEEKGIYDPTMPEMVRICTEPSEIADSFLKDKSLWEIKGEKQYLERNCYIIEGNAKNVKDNDKFKFFVDSQTGILLYYVGYDTNGDLSDYMYTEEISFDYDGEKVNNLLEEKEGLGYEKEYDYAPVISDFRYNEEWIEKRLG